ncbi:MAG TPA: sugar ABC transporter permease [Bacilli bacterium]
MKKSRIYSYERRRMYEGMGFISIWFIGFIAFMLYPLISSLKVSFTKSTLNDILGGPFIGFENYKSVFLDPQFSMYFLDTLTNSLMDIPIIVIFSLFVAVLLNSDIRGRGVFRAVFFIPVIISGVVMNRLFQQGVSDISIFDTLGGGMLLISDMIGSGLFNRMGLIFWRSSVEILIFLAALQGIPKSQYEAAQVDGATGWECFWKITLPYISPVVLLNMIYATIDTFTDPLNPMMDFLKNKIFSQFNFGYASALSWLYFLVAMIFIAVIIGIGRRFVTYGGDRS